MEYHYPIDPDWSTDEVIQVIDFFQTVEKAYEKEANAQQILTQYKKFKEVVPSKAEEKTVFKQFEKHSGYVPYKVVKAAKEAEGSQLISLKK
ncbi:UPF0223 family protein [Piscibacillus halophilus]|uniref:UPF0223 protein SAMN05216362_1655 n=1 Tax=Piscibacillus halophilus TaxID=571933 RepID=A0A1H9MMP2_9BACI|nr:UPF0223 family protein [Piscibacillus halophilus]SER24433.1 Uncharacterized protein YktA, UPF0223 family [Piscibacillus halophilus]